MNSATLPGAAPLVSIVITCFNYARFVAYRQTQELNRAIIENAVAQGQQYVVQSTGTQPVRHTTSASKAKYRLFMSAILGLLRRRSYKVSLPGCFR